MIRPSRSSFVLSFASLALLACGAGSAGQAVRPADPTANEALGKGGVCTLTGEPQLLTLDWEDTQRIDLERAMSKHVAVVHYDCNGFKVLRDCEVEGGYEYAGVSPAKTTAKLKDADEVKANLAIGAVDISGAVKRGSTIDIIYLAVGQQATTVHDVPSAKLKGTCEGATHTVRTANLGAFALTTGTQGEVNAAVGLLGKGGSASSSSSKELQRINGELDACNAASDTAKEPTNRCRALVQLLLSPVGGAPGEGSRLDSVTDKSDGAGSKAGDDRKSLRTIPIVNHCGSGLKLSKDNVCSKAPAAYMCDAANLDECKAQCEKGDGRSCYNAAANRLDRKMNAAATKTDDREKEAFPFLEKSCAAGYAAGCADLGYSVQYGRGTERNRDKAEQLLTKGCSMGDSVACSFLANAFMYGSNGFKKDQGLTRKYYERSCSLGSHDSCREASRMYVDGIGGPKDVAAAAKLLERSCAGGNDDNCKRGQAVANSEGSMASDGEKVSLHEELRTSYSSTEPLKNPCKSTLRVDDKEMKCIKPEGAASFVCDATNYDECKAQCDKGNGRSCWQAAANRLSSSNQNRGDRGREEAFPWFEKGCTAGYKPACTLFANAVMSGHGTTANKERGRTLMEKACDLGDPPACTMMASNLRYGGNGFAKDPNKSVDLYEKACGLGSNDACMDGASNVSKTDPAREKKLLDMACKAGEQRGCSRLESLAKAAAKADKPATPTTPTPKPVTKPAGKK
jgi:TPR repeat protein